MTRARRCFMLRCAVWVVVGACVVVFARRLDRDQVIRSFQGVDLGLALAATLVCVPCSALQGLRWGALVRGIRRVPRSTPIAALYVGQAASAFLPMRAGEAVRTELLARATGIRRATALGTVALDHSVNAVVMFAFAALLPALLPVPRWVAALVWTGMGGAIILVLTLLWLAKHPESMPVGRIANAVARARSGLMAARDPRAVAQAALFSALAWSLEIAVTMLALGAFHQPHDLPHAMGVIFGINLALAIPSPPASLGNFELGAVSVLVAFWGDAGQAAAFAGGVHDRVGHRLDAVAAEQVAPGDHTDHAAGARDLAGLFVGEVALEGCEPPEPGVRRQQRSGRHSQDVREGAVRTVGHVDEDSELLATPHQIAPEPGETGSAAQDGEEGQARHLRRLRDAVVHEMREGEIAQPALGQPLQLLQRPLEVMPSFERMDHGQLASFQYRSDFSFPPGDLRQRRVARAEALQRRESAERGAKRRNRQHRRRVHAVRQDPQPSGARPRQIELLPERVPPSRPGVLAPEIAPQVVGVQRRMRVQIGDGRAGVDRRRVPHQCWVTRTVVFICLPVSGSLADMVRMPSMFTLNVISRRAFPAGPGLRPLKRKSPSSSLCKTCGLSPWKMRIATSVWPS